MEYEDYWILLLILHTVLHFLMLKSVFFFYIGIVIELYNIGQSY